MRVVEDADPLKINLPRKKKLERCKIKFRFCKIVRNNLDDPLKKKNVSENKIFKQQNHKFAKQLHHSSLITPHLSASETSPFRQNLRF